MSNSTLSIRQARKLSAKQTLKNWLGRCVAMTKPARAAELESSPLVDPRSLADKVLMFHLRQRALAENQQDFLDRLHQQFWASDQGAQFSENCDHRFQDLFLAKQQADFVALQDAWNSLDALGTKSTEGTKQIVEIGTSSGLLLAYLTQHLADVSRATGIDINAAQIERNLASSNFDSRIKFLCTDGQQWILKNAQPATLFVTNGGVLEYFRREKLDEMMRHIATSCGPAIFFASEPIAGDHDFETNSDSIPFGEELSFSHNYRDLFESNGFQVQHQRVVDYEAWKMQVTIATASTAASAEQGACAIERELASTNQMREER